MMFGWRFRAARPIAQDGPSGAAAAGRGSTGGPESDAWFHGEPLVALEHVDFAYHGPYGDLRGDPRDGGTVDGASDETDGHVVLRDCSLTLERGECVALLGPNGAGKTTIMRIINALEFPDAGTYRFCGTAVTRARVEARDGLFAKTLHQCIGFVFQNSDTQLFCPSVAEEIAFGPMQMGLDDAEVRARVDDMIALFGLERLRDRAPYRLSGGEKKRVAIACCLSMNPDLLVLDEPTDGLDERNTDVVVQVLRAFVEAGKTVLLSTHHHDIVERLEARVIRITPRE